MNMRIYINKFHNFSMIIFLIFISVFVGESFIQKVIYYNIASLMLIVLLCFESEKITNIILKNKKTFYLIVIHIAMTIIIHTSIFYNKNSSDFLTYIYLINLISIMIFCLYISIVLKLIGGMDFLIILLILFGLISVFFSIFDMVNLINLDFLVNNSPWIYESKKYLSGYYSYKNSYATYISILLFFSLGLISSGINRSRMCKFFLKTSIFVFSIALLYTGSRLCLLILVFVLLINYKNTNSSLLESSIIVKFFILLFIIIGGFLAYENSHRIFSEGFNLNNRDLIYFSAIKMMMSYEIIFGYGPGVYEYIQNIYKPGELGFTEMSKYAHNDYLEYIINNGLLSLILFLMILYINFERVKYFFLNDDCNEIFYFKISLQILILSAFFDFVFVNLNFFVMLFINYFYLKMKA